MLSNSFHHVTAGSIYQGDTVFHIRKLNPLSDLLYAKQTWDELYFNVNVLIMHYLFSVMQGND
jgi:hypothetical protein